MQSRRKEACARCRAGGSIFVGAAHALFRTAKIDPGDTNQGRVTFLRRSRVISTPPLTTLLRVPFSSPLSDRACLLLLFDGVVWRWAGVALQGGLEVAAWCPDALNPALVWRVVPRVDAVEDEHPLIAYAALVARGQADPGTHLACGERSVTGEQLTPRGTQHAVVGVTPLLGGAALVLHHTGRW